MFDKNLVCESARFDSTGQSVNHGGTSLAPKSDIDFASEDDTDSPTEDDTEDKMEERKRRLSQGPWAEPSKWQSC